MPNFKEHDNALREVLTQAKTIAVVAPSVNQHTDILYVEILHTKVLLELLT